MPVIDTHRHPFGAGSKQLFSSVGAYDPQKLLRQAARGTVFYAEWLDGQTTVAEQREGGVTRALLGDGGELELLSQLAGGDEQGTLRTLLEDKLELIERYPEDFGLMAEANPFDYGPADRSSRSRP